MQIRCRRRRLNLQQCNNRRSGPTANWPAKHVTRHYLLALNVLIACCVTNYWHACVRAEQFHSSIPAAYARYFVKLQ